MAELGQVLYLPTAYSDVMPEWDETLALDVAIA
jgi:hypothetical protein